MGRSSNFALNLQRFKEIGIASLVLSLSLMSLSSAAVLENQYDAKTKENKPNILLVVADDLGMFDIGAFGGEIRTPNIDALASKGIRFNQFYTAATCSPTRAMLMSGADNHSAGIGNMVEHFAPNQSGRRGYEGHLSNNVVSVATLLKDNGYRTFMAGKWHLGKGADQLPGKRGFDQSFSLLQGGASYFNDMMGLTSKVPQGLYRLNGASVTTLPEDFYASEYYADFIIDQIEKTDKGSNTKLQTPFFAYLAFTAPHWPLQVRDEHLDLYKGQYDIGYDALQLKRIEDAISKGILSPNTQASDRATHIKAWNQLTIKEKKQEARTMEIYASVVERMDFHLGRVLTYLDQNNLRNNTIIIFLSDNGPDGSDRSKLPGNEVWLPQAWDLSYDNMGKVGSYLFPGPGWARASAGPLKLYKSFATEGGIRSPAIVSFPGISKIGKVSDAILSVKDITPTILEFAGIKNPEGEYKGATVEKISGLSFLPILNDEAQFIRNDDAYLGWELFGHRAIRQGDWKLVWLSSKPYWLEAPADPDKWALYNIKNDPGEQNDVSQSKPEKLKQLVSLWKQYAAEESIVLPTWTH